MHVDSYGLPCQADGNCEDQLNRVGLISLSCLLNYWHDKSIPDDFEALCDDAISDPMGLLVYGPGVYTRHANSGPDDVTCDQLIPIIAYHISMGDKINSSLMFKAMVKRFGFAQNVHKDGEPETKTTPDFMVFRALPLFARHSKWLYPLALISDLYLLVMSISSILISRNDLNSVDDNNLIATLLTCLTTYPTFVSKLSAFVYKRLSPTNYGVIALGETANIQGKMSWYHRAASGGNPEIAEMYRNLIKEHLS